MEENVQSSEEFKMEQHYRGSDPKATVQGTAAA